jgi:hypothetical protein
MNVSETTSANNQLTNDFRVTGVPFSRLSLSTAFSRDLGSGRRSSGTLPKRIEPNRRRHAFARRGGEGDLFSDFDPLKTHPHLRGALTRPLARRRRERHSPSSAPSRFRLTTGDASPFEIRD